MKKRVLLLALCGALLLPGAARGSEILSFSDVPAGSWFEKGVLTCAERGVMVGTAEEIFSPHTQLSKAECLTLALRLYDLQQGGAGELEKAPEEWGKITFTLADGKVVEGRQNAPFGFASFRRDGGADAHLYFSLEPEQVEWGKSVDARAAAVTMDGKTFSGVAQCWEPAKDGHWVLSFYSDGEDGSLRALYDSPHPAPGEWYRDAVYTAEVWGLNDRETHHGFWELGRDLGFDQVGLEETCRYQFAAALAEAAGELPRLYEVAELPDLERDSAYTGTDAFYTLYEAGILTGTDEYGSVGYFDTLTRAQAAVMVARVLDEDQRVRTPPRALPYLEYTLTEVDLQGWEPLGGGNGEGADWLPVHRWDEAKEGWRTGIYRSDGTILEAELEGGEVWAAPGPYTAGDSRYAAVARLREEPAPEEDEYAYGLFDVTEGKMAVPYQDYEGYLAAARPLWDKEQREFCLWDEDTSFSAFRDGQGNLFLANFWLDRYYNTDHVPVSPQFEWVGPVDQAGAGFVGKDGAVYRIRFQI